MVKQKQPIYVGGVGHHPIDPAWNPHVLVSRRLRDACILHASRLAEGSTGESSLCSLGDLVKSESSQVIHPLAQMALPRSSCPQPPLDDGVTGGGSSVSCNLHFSGMNVRLDPLERAAPHRIVVPGSDEDGIGFGDDAGGTRGFLIRGELDGVHDSNNLGEQRSATWNAITALSQLCDEIHDLDKTFESQILPSIVLFSANDSIVPSQSQGDASKTDILDEGAQKTRESALLARIGKFVPSLQLAANGTARLRRLVKNMVVQLGGCTTPAAVPFYFEGCQDKKIDEETDVNDDSHEATSNSSPASNAVKSKEEQTDDVASANRGVQQSHSSGEQPPVFGTGAPLFKLGKAIGTALRILIAIDAAVASNGDLQEAWAIYKDVVMDWSEQRRSESKLDAEFESFERMMVQLDFNLLSSRSFIATIEQNFDPRGRFQTAKFNLHEEVKSILMTLYGQYCERINTEHETTERLDCVGVYAMYVLYRHLLPPNIIPDAKLHKSLWSVFPAMCPIMELFGPLHFIPREFIMLHAPYEAVKNCSSELPEIQASSAALVLKWDGSFVARVSKIKLDALGWIATADSELSSTVIESHPESPDDDDIVDADGSKFNLPASVTSIERATSCILRGLKIAHSASILLHSQLVSHRAFGLNHDPRHTSSLLSLIEVLKSIEKMLRVRRRSAVIAFQRSTLKMIASNILKKFDKVRSFVDQSAASLDTSRSSDRARSIARVSACLSALEGILKGTSSFSPIRRYSISFTISACMDSTILETFSPDDLLAVEGYLKDLNEVSSIEEELNQVCDCSFLYFHRDIFPRLVKELCQISISSSIERAQLVLSAISDPEGILKRAKHVEIDQLTGSTACFTTYQRFVSEVMSNEYINPLCKIIELDLRLAVHSKSVDSSKHPPANVDCIDKRVRNVLNAPPLRVCQRKIHVKNQVTSYLEKAFYNLCTLSLNDCNTYNEMIIVANERYGIHLLDFHLPDGRLEQGNFDFIDTLRDVELFVSRYNYNMIEQSFIERKPEHGAKYLCTINVKCISSSLIQHGLGVVSSAVNISYKVLAKKFQKFTQFLADDHVKSLLSKEVRWLNTQKNEGNTIYPYNRASSFAQEIKKLGQTHTGNNGLDECRTLITEMGNVISFVRMLRSAKRMVQGSEMQFLPPQEGFIREKMLPSSTSKNEQSEEESRVDETIYEVLKRSDPDFVRAFVNVFKGVIAKSDNSFMGGFFCMVPALCLCWMEASLQGKEMMHKKNITRDGFFTDDGFAVGLAFSLAVLGQVKQYESLNWFKSIQNKYVNDEEDLTEKMKAEEIKRQVAKQAAAKQSSWFSSGTEDATEGDDEDELRLLKMMGKRLEGNRREMAMLFFSIHGAQAFFKDLRIS